MPADDILVMSDGLRGEADTAGAQSEFASKERDFAASLDKEI